MKFILQFSKVRCTQIVVISSALLHSENIFYNSINSVHSPMGETNVHGSSWSWRALLVAASVSWTRVLTQFHSISNSWSLDSESIFSNLFSNQTVWHPLNRYLPDWRAEIITQADATQYVLKEDSKGSAAANATAFASTLICKGDPPERCRASNFTARRIRSVGQDSPQAGFSRATAARSPSNGPRKLQLGEDFIAFSRPSTTFT